MYTVYTQITTVLVYMGQFMKIYSGMKNRKLVCLTLCFSDSKYTLPISYFLTRKCRMYMHVSCQMAIGYSLCVVLKCNFLQKT